MSNLHVYKVSRPADLEKAYAIRTRVFVDEQGCPPELEQANNHESTHFLAIIDQQACGACRWRKTSEGYKLERFAVLSTHRGHGVGRAMVAAVLADLPADAAYIYLNAQLDAVSLYAKFGFVTEGPQFEEAGIQHYKMVKKA